MNAGYQWVTLNLNESHAKFPWLKSVEYFKNVERHNDIERIEQGSLAKRK